MAEFNTYQITAETDADLTIAGPNGPVTIPASRASAIGPQSPAASVRASFYERPWAKYVQIAHVNYTDGTASGYSGQIFEVRS